MVSFPATLSTDTSSLLARISGQHYRVREAYPRGNIRKLEVRVHADGGASAHMADLSFRATSVEGRSLLLNRIRSGNADASEVWRGPLIVVDNRTGLSLLNKGPDRKKVKIELREFNGRRSIALYDNHKKFTTIFQGINDLNLKLITKKDIITLNTTKLALRRGVTIEWEGSLSTDFDNLLIGMTKSIRGQFNSDLITACENLDMLGAAESLANGADVNAARDRDGATPLHIAASSMFLGGLSVLLNGADLEEQLPDEGDYNYAPYGGKAAFLAKVRAATAELDPLKRDASGRLPTRCVTLQLGHDGIAKISERTFNRVWNAELKAAEIRGIDYYEMGGGQPGAVTKRPDFDVQEWANEPPAL